MTMRRDEALQVLARHAPNDVVAAAYSTAFDWIAIRPHPLNYTSIGAMGLCSSHALGIALARPDKRVIVLDGDGSLLMNLGTLATIANAAPENLVHMVAENGTYEANGAHPIPAQRTVDFAAMARAAGYRSAHVFDDLATFDREVPDVLAGRGPVFVTLKVVPGAPSPMDYGDLYSAKRREAFRQALAA